MSGIPRRLPGWLRRGVLVCASLVPFAPPAPSEEVRARSSVSDRPDAEAGLVAIDGGRYRFRIDTTQAPDLAPWTETKLVPVIKEWYPKIVGMLPGAKYEAPTTFSVVFDPGYTGVAATTGTAIVCNPAWYRQELKREALGSVVHELVHVVQHYGRQPVPGWLTEGIADYIRWYRFEPHSRGCEIPPEAAESVRHDQGYRVTANFINWVTGHHDKDLVKELNAALREGRYAPELWSQRTSLDLPTLADQWKKSLAGAR